MRRSGQPLLILAVAGALLAAACSGGDGDSSSTEASSAPATEPATTDAPPATDAPVDTEPPEPATTVATTTTTEPPVVVPLGVRWEGPAAAAVDVRQGVVADVTVLGDEIWIVTKRWNAPVLLRSGDGGASWDEITVEPPQSSGAVTIREVVQGPDGRYVGHGLRLSDCITNLDVGGGYREPGICRIFRAVVFLSDDGTTWRRIEPDVMTPPSGTSTRIESMIATDDGFVAAGTLLNADWRTAIWTSPDGENWSLARELRGIDGPTSPTTLLSDGDTLVLLAEEHQCAVPGFNPSPGWILGTAWPNDGRVWEGTSVDDLTLRGPGEHPLAHEPRVVDCSVDTSFDLDNVPFPELSGAMVGGEIVILEEFLPPEQRAALESDDEDVDPDTIGTRRLARMSGGTWDEILIEGVRAATGFTHNVALLDVDGEPGILEFRTGSAPGLVDIIPILPIDGGYVQQPVDRSVVGEGVSDAVWFDGALVAAGILLDDQFVAVRQFDDAGSVAVWRSVETTGERDEPCDLVPGGVCQFTDLSTIDGYPDFAGIDLSGANLSYSDLGEADFTGANLVGARLVGVESDDGSLLVGANLTDAIAANGELGDASGATFVGANLVRARIAASPDADFSFANLDSADIRDASNAILGGATLEFADLAFFEFPNLEGVSLGRVKLEPLADPGTTGREISLAGFDLTDTDVWGQDDDDRLVITDLTGAVLVGTALKAVDLTQIDPAIDLTEVDVWDDSLCPDGLPPDDGVIGTCVRGLAEG